MQSAMNFRAAILTDLDNTIYNWVDYFAPSFRAMVHVLARRTSVDEEAIVNDFRRVFNQHGSVEYAFSVQELRLCHDLSEPEVADLVRVAKGAFSRVREKNLKVYPGVKETLRWAKEERIAVIAVTNSPIFPARMRLRQLKVDGLFTGIAAWEGFEIPDEDPWAQPVRVREANGGWRTKLGTEWTFGKDQLKPSPEMYRTVLAELGLDPSKVWVVGDSLHKDIAPALEVGANGVWAKYGLRFEEKNFATLLSITDWSNDRIAKTYSENAVEPTSVIETFADMRQCIPALQASLFTTALPAHS